MVNVWLGRAMTYDIVSAALVSEIERLHAGGMPGCLCRDATDDCLSRALLKWSVYMGNGWPGRAVMPLMCVLCTRL